MVYLIVGSSLFWIGLLREFTFRSVLAGVCAVVVADFGWLLVGGCCCVEVRWCC